VDSNAAPVEAKTEEPTPAPEPITWEALKLPETLTVNEPIQKSFLEIVNKDMTPLERSQALLDLHGQVAKEFSDSATAEWNKIQDEWVAAAKADPDIGGDKLDPALGRISKLVDEFGTPELRAAFDLTGAGNNPHVIKFLHNVALKLTEGGPAGGSPAKGPADLAKTLFPSMN